MTDSDFTSNKYHNKVHQLTIEIIKCFKHKVVEHTIAEIYTLRLFSNHCIFIILIFHMGIGDLISCTTGPLARQHQGM
jgi:hypothetical protein